MLNVLRDQLLVFLYAFLERLQDNRIFLGDSLQNLLLLRLQSLEAKNDVRSHVMTLALQFNTVDYLVQRVDSLLGAFHLSVELRNQLAVVAQLVLAQLELISRVVLAQVVDVVDLLLEDRGSLLVVHDLRFVQQVELLLDVGDLVCDRRVLLRDGFPVADQVLDDLEPLDKLIQTNQHADVLARVVVGKVDLNLRSFVELLLLVRLLSVRVPQFLDHPRELHHIQLTARNLLRHQALLLAVFDQVCLDHAEQLADVGILACQELEALHAVQSLQLVLELGELMQLMCRDLELAAFIRFILGLIIGFLASLLLVGFLGLQVVFKLRLESLHLHSDGNQPVANVGLPRLGDLGPLDTICLGLLLESGFASCFIDCILFNVRFVLHVAHNGVLGVLLLLLIHRIEIILRVGRLEDFLVFLL